MQHVQELHASNRKELRHYGMNPELEKELEEEKKKMDTVQDSFFQVILSILLCIT